jgi:thiol-disulfide isomerase/thioredoxin
MKKIAVLILTSFTFLSCNKTDKEILNKTISKLNSLKTIEYELENKSFIKSYAKKTIDTAICYIDFTSKDTLIGAKYQFVSKYGEQVFSGSHEFIVLSDKELVLHTDQPIKNRVLSTIFLQNSVFEIRKTLPKLVIDTTAFISRLKDTVIDKVDCYRFNILMTEKMINVGGELTKFEGKADSLNYFLTISKKDYLPVQFGMFYPENNGYKVATFKKLKEVAPKNDSIWNYNRMYKGYLRSTYTDHFNALKMGNKEKIGIDAPNWKLPMVQGDSIQLSEIKEKLVLLEFWFPHCKGCVLATPEINKIQEKYKTKGLMVLGIEITEKPESVLIDYIQEQKIEYPTLYNGKETAKKYGVYAAPTFFLIDKKGKVIYTSVGLDKKQLIKEIENII